MSTTTTPNMGLTAPGVGTEIGPNWAQEINGDLSILDSHNHSSGQGVQISPPGMNINTDLPFNSNNATLLRSTRFFPELSAIASASPDQGCLYIYNNGSSTELYYNDYANNQVPITKNGAVNSGAGSISNLPFSGAASYSGGTYTWEAGTSGSPAPASMASGSLLISPSTAFTNAVTLQANSSLATSYAWTFPLLQASSAGSVLISDASGNLSYGVIDGTTLSLSGGNLSVRVIQTANIANGAVTRPKLAAVGQQISASCGTFSTSSTSLVDVTNLTNTITTSGRPVMIFLQGIAVTIPNSQMSVLWGSASSEVSIVILSSSNSGSSYTNICQWRFNQTVSSGNTQELNNSYLFMDTPAATSGLIYKVQVAVQNSSDLLSFESITLVTYEL